jgi:membrane associated rhomboid family serine protease
MIPINDTEPNRYSRFPAMTVSLIVINTLILVWELSLPFDELYRLVKVYGATSSLIFNRQGAGVISVITCMFLHGGIMHLVGNMFFLWVFGRRVEDACGPIRFLAYYVLAGTTATLITVLTGPNDPTPGIGASGAIFGVMGAYFVLFPGGRIRTLWFISFIPTWPKFRAFWFVLYYLAIQIPPAIDTYVNGSQYGIGHWAHLGGFFACIFIPLFMRPEAFARYMSDVPV